MHVATLLFANMFDVEIDGRPSSIADVFPQWNAHDRFGILIDAPLGGLGATHLIQIAITSFYDVKPSRRAERKIYPEIYAIHIGQGYGMHGNFDFWPPRRERIIPDDPRQLLDTINDLGLTRLALPPRPIRSVVHRPKEVDTALDRIASAIIYSPSGRVEGPDFSIHGNDRRTEYNPGHVLKPVIATPTARSGTKRPPSLLKETDPEWSEHQLRRQGEISQEDRIAAKQRRAAITTSGLVTETYRFTTAEEALGML